MLLAAGYAAKAGLVPCHAWAEQTLAAGPAANAVLMGSILNAGLVILLRLRGVVAATPGTLAPGPLLMALGLATLLAAAFALRPRRDGRRFLALSTIAGSGVAAFAFGLGGEATLAGLVLLTAATLATTAALSLVAGPRALGLTFVAALAALAGLPPFGLFAGYFLLAVATLRTLPWLMIPLGLGLAVAGWAVAMRLAGLGPPAPDRGPGWTAQAPAWLHLAALLILGLAATGPLAAWLAAAASVVR